MKFRRRGRIHLYTTTSPETVVCALQNRASVIATPSPRAKGVYHGYYNGTSQRKERFEIRLYNAAGRLHDDLTEHEAAMELGDIASIDIETDDPLAPLDSVCANMTRVFGGECTLRYTGIGKTVRVEAPLKESLPEGITEIVKDGLVCGYMNVGSAKIALDLLRRHGFEPSIAYRSKNLPNIVSFNEGFESVGSFHEAASNQSGSTLFIRRDEDPNLLARLKDGSYIEYPIDEIEDPKLKATRQLIDEAILQYINTQSNYPLPRDLSKASTQSLVTEHIVSLITPAVSVESNELRNAIDSALDTIAKIGFTTASGEHQNIDVRVAEHRRHIVDMLTNQIRFPKLRGRIQDLMAKAEALAAYAAPSPVSSSTPRMR